MEPATPVDYAAVLVALEKKRAVLDAAIAGIKVLMGDADAMIAELAATPPAPENPGVLDAHAFFGMNIATAAHKYLTITKKPATAADIAVALENGGFPSQSGNFGSTITTALYRQKDTFVRVKRGLWGLKVWYPNYRAPD